MYKRQSSVFDHCFTFHPKKRKHHQFYNVSAHLIPIYHHLISYQEVQRNNFESHRMSVAFHWTFPVFSVRS